MPILTRLLPLVAASLLIGCASEPLHLPDEGPTSKEVFEGHSGETESTAGIGTGQLNAYDVLPYDPHVTEWSRTLTNETNQLFPQVPNHQIIGYVYPHLTAKGHPVPGYTTGFYLYEKHHYALPGEVPVSKIPPRLKRR